MQCDCYKIINSITKERKQNNDRALGKDNKTIALYYRIKLTKDEKVYLDKEDISKSFTRQFASIILSVFGMSSVCRRFDGTSFNFPALSATLATSVYALRDYTILFSDNENDKYLTFDDFRISQASNITRVSGYPQVTNTFYADRCEINVSDAYMYHGNDTKLYSIGLRVTVSWGAVSNAQLLITKDVFEPALDLMNNSRVDLSYKFVIAV